MIKWKIMKKKVYYKPHEYIELLNFCITTTNIGKQAESIIRTIYRRYICNDSISFRQYQVLHNISVMCVDSHPKQNILKSIKFAGPSEGLPIFVMRPNDRLDFPKEKITQKEIVSNDAVI